MTWGGAQWVLICILVARLTIPLMVRAAGVRQREQFWGWYAAKAFDQTVLVAILLWGGFWA